MEHLLNDGSLAQWRLGLQEGQADIYHINVDSVTKHSGKYSLKISGSNSSGTYCSAYLQLPAIYAGKKITLKGFMKTQGVTNGFAGLFMSLETTNYVYFYNNMQDQNIHGDNNWSEYKIEFNYNPEITRINIGGLLVGQGNVWLDDLSISIDDENIQNAARKFISQWYKDTSFEMGSKISIKATPIVNHSLNILGQVWGFLKYHHPLIASGKLNWDAELLKELPRIIPITSNQELMRELEGWIDKYPLYKTCDTCLNKIDSSKISVFSDYGDLFKDGFLNDPVRNKLMKLLKNTSFDSSYYIELDKNAGNAKFKNEKSYQNGFPDDGLRLLGLFRYWASIQYFYPFRNNLKGKWNEILLAFIPDMLNSRDSLKYYSTCLRLVSEIHDSHATLFYSNQIRNSLFGAYYPNFTTQIIEGKLVVDDIFSENNNGSSILSKGDIISKIEGVPTGKYIDSLGTFFSSSTMQALERDINPYLLRGHSDFINITFSHNGKIETGKFARVLTKRLGKLQASAEKDSCYKLLPGNIGYIAVDNYKNSYLKDIKKMFSNTKAMIIDMRGYPGEFMPYTFGNYIKNKFSIFARFSAVDFKHPGLFYFQRIFSNGDESEKSYTGSVVVLVNELTQSQAEFTTMAFQSSSNTKVIGSPTAGTDGNITKIILPGGIETWMSGVGVFYPDRTPTQNIGIKIDIPVKRTIDGFIKKKDEILEKALEYLNKKK